MTDSENSQGNSKPRAVILTAIPDEYTAVRAHLTEIQEKVHPSGTIYERGKFSTDGRVWDVIIVEIGLGNIVAAAQTERAIASFHPDVMLFVGVAGGIKDVKLGDVVASTKIYGYESGKAEEFFKPRPEIGLSSYELEQRAKFEAKRNDWLQRLPSIPDPTPSVIVAPIGSGEKVVASTQSEVFKFLRSNYGDAVTVEMEGRGFLETVRAHRQVSAMVIRGVSDLIDDKSEVDDRGYQPIAACHASAFAFQVLAKFSPEYFAGIPQERIQQAYQDFLPADAEVWDLESNNWAQILNNLAKFRQLEHFLECLIQDPDIPQESRNHLQVTLGKVAQKKPVEAKRNKSSRGSSPHPSAKLNSYLLVTLTRDGELQQFLLNAWLIKDYGDDTVEDLSKYEHLLDPISCKLTQVPRELDKLIQKAQRSLGIKESCLTIEFFLPIDLMGMEIDRWQITGPIKKIPLGIKYPIRLRSLERLDLDYLYSYWPQWCESWKEVRNILENRPSQERFEHLDKMEGFNWKLLSYKLKDKIGLKMTCAHPPSMRSDLFSAILYATTPIAIWTRTDILNVDGVTAIDELLTRKPLCHLCESVREIREEADAQTEEHLGFHLALLWENPYRLTPDVLVALSSPGE
ncbi:MAG: 5'-methylthioadenosine/S-adenosylhomocysteine nucleosidase [Symploca sp. SIO2E6]|nr:5'-methylthioadenosine/S-adenosylhomocysteine nucleosidase [Symploca sp. SIO2E6]